MGCCWPEPSSVPQVAKQVNLNPQAKIPDRKPVVQSSDYPQRLSELQQKEKTLKDRWNQLNEQMRMLQVRMQQQNNQRNQMMKDQANLKSQIQQKQERIKALQDQINKTKFQIEKVSAQTDLPNRFQSRSPASPVQVRNTAELDVKLAQLKNLTANQERQRNRLQSLINQATFKIEQIQKQIIPNSNNIEKLKLDQSQINSQILTLRQNIEKAQYDLKQRRQTRTLNAQQIEKIKRDTQDIEEQIRALSKQHINTNEQRSNTKRFLQFFAGEILQNEDHYKQFLTSVLENRLKNKIASTKMIYRFDNLNKVNFHKYIDEKPNIVVLVKLVNGYILGAWCEGSFRPRMVSDKDGLIFSLTNLKVFEPLQRNRRAIAYDDFFLIFGNSELRLKSQDTKVFSNFAISNGYYNSRGEKVDILLGSGTIREVDMESLEVFQLHLQ